MLKFSCVIAVTAICCVLLSGCDVANDAPLHLAAAGKMSANPCTAVALTTPVQAWTSPGDHPSSESSDVRAVTGVSLTVPPKSFVVVPPLNAVSDVDGNLHAGAVLQGGILNFTATDTFVYYPIPVLPGRTLDGFTWYAVKNNATSVLVADLIETDVVNASFSALAGSRVTAGAGTEGDQIISASGVAHVMSPAKTYAVRVAAHDVANGLDTFGTAVIRLQ